MCILAYMAHTYQGHGVLKPMRVMEISKDQRSIESYFKIFLTHYSHHYHHWLNQAPGRHLPASSRCELTIYGLVPVAPVCTCIGSFLLSTPRILWHYCTGCHNPNMPKYMCHSVVGGGVWLMKLPPWAQHGSLYVSISWSSHEYNSQTLSTKILKRSFMT